MAYSSAQQTVDAPRGIWKRLGLLGGDPGGALRSASDTFANGDFEISRQQSQHASDLINGASSVAFRRLLNRHGILICLKVENFRRAQWAQIEEDVRQNKKDHLIDFVLELKQYLYATPTTRNGRAGGPPVPRSNTQIRLVLGTLRSMLAWAAEPAVGKLPPGWANPFTRGGCTIVWWLVASRGRTGSPTSTTKVVGNTCWMPRAQRARSATYRGTG